MTRRKKIYEGKAKILYEGPEPGTLIQYFKDDTTAFDATKKAVLEGKGVINNRISEYIMTKLNSIGVQNHFIKRLNLREFAAGIRYRLTGSAFEQALVFYQHARELFPQRYRDLARLRTNYRQREEAYLYRLRASPEQVRHLFLEYLATLNSLKATPRWYHAIGNNCTTSIRTQRAASDRTPWDWRLLVNGFGDQLLYEKGAISTNVPFLELKEKCHINQRARAADKSPDFSRLIRVGVPGME